MFLLNSCLSLFSAATSQWHPFSRSYGAILPSSLTMLLPSALGFSPHPPVSVYGTGTCGTIAAFLGTASSSFATFFRSLSHARIALRTSLQYSSHAWPGFLSPGFGLGNASPHFLTACGTGISTRCPSATPFGLALGPDLPRADQLYPGNLGYSAGRILTFLSLLIPAFSLHAPPPPLVSTASPTHQCSPTNRHETIPGLRCQVLAPDIFGAGPLD